METEQRPDPEKELRRLAKNAHLNSVASVIRKINWRPDLEKEKAGQKQEPPKVTASELKLLAKYAQASAGEELPTNGELVLNSSQVESGKITCEGLALLLGVSERRVQQLELPRAKQGVYLLKRSVQEALALKAGNGQSEDPRLVAEKLRKLTAEAQLKEMELNREKGKLLEAEEVETEWLRLLGTIKARLQAMPATLASAVLGCSDFASAKKVAEAEVRKVLADLSEQREDQEEEKIVPGNGKTEGEGTGDAGPAAGADSQPVGGQVQVAVAGVVPGAGAVAHEPGPVPAGNDGRVQRPDGGGDRPQAVQPGGQD